MGWLIWSGLSRDSGGMGLHQEASQVALTAKAELQEQERHPSALFRACARLTLFHILWTRAGHVDELRGREIDSVSPGRGASKSHGAGDGQGWEITAMGATVSPAPLPQSLCWPVRRGRFSQPCRGSPEPAQVSTPSLLLYSTSLVRYWPIMTKTSGWVSTLQR